MAMSMKLSVPIRGQYFQLIARIFYGQISWMEKQAPLERARAWHNLPEDPSQCQSRVHDLIKRSQNYRATWTRVVLA